MSGSYHISGPGREPGPDDRCGRAGTTNGAGAKLRITFCYISDIALVILGKLTMEYEPNILRPWGLTWWFTTNDENWEAG